MKFVNSTSSLLAVVALSLVAFSASADDLLDANAASEADLNALAELNDTTVAAIVGGRPFDTIGDLDAVLGGSLSDEERESLYGKLFIKINLNTASRENILLIPGVGSRMAHEFEEYRPYASMEQFRREIGKYVDEGISGTKGRDRRPAFDDLCQAIARKEFDMVMAWSVDRLGRSLQDLVAFLSEIHAKGIDLYLHKQGIDTSTPAGKAIFQMMGVFAEFEREIIRERVNAGLARARENGTKTGRPIGRPKSVTLIQERSIKKARAKGRSLRKIAKEKGVSLGTVQRVLAA